MDKKLKFSLISYTILTAVVLSFLTTYRFFRGAGVTFVAILVCLAILTYYFVSDSYVRSRTRDIFIVSIVFTVLEFVTFVAFEFPYSVKVDVFKGFWNYQVVLSCLGLLFFIYAIFRFIYEEKNLRLGFVETILGNKRVVRKAKQAKEFTNGSLEAKPNRKHVDTVSDIPTTKEEQKQEENAVNQTATVNAADKENSMVKETSMDTPEEQ